MDYISEKMLCIPDVSNLADDILNDCAIISNLAVIYAQIQIQIQNIFIASYFTHIWHKYKYRISVALQ